MTSEWKETISENGDKYYYNESTNETKWEAPENFEPAVPPVPSRSAPVYSPDSESTPTPLVHSTTTTTTVTTDTATKAPASTTSNLPEKVTTGENCQCCPPALQPCCNASCGTWQKRLRISTTVSLLVIFIEELLIGVLFLIFFDSGVAQALLDDVSEAEETTCGPVASGQSLPRFYVAAGLLWALGVSFLSFHRGRKFVTFRGFGPPSTQHGLQIKLFFLCCMIANGAYSIYALGLPLLLLEVIPAGLMLACVLVDSWRTSDKKNTL